MRKSTVIAMLVIVACIAMGLIVGCKATDSGMRTKANANALSIIAQQDIVKWNKFLECSKDEGDLGCDSCFTMIYGYSLEFK